MIFFFFFSSRRRHTRFDYDWSSDVCSSDLTHGIQNEDAVQSVNDFGDGLPRIEQPRGCFMMDHSHGMDLRVLAESEPQTLGIRPLSPIILELRDPQAMQPDHL